MQHSGAHIAFAGVGLTYPEGPACENVTFEIAPGESVALIGPSGCGKSTTLHLAVGLVAPTAGSVRINGEPPARPRRETAFIPQDLGLLPWKTVLQNAMLPLTLRRTPKREAADRARRALARVGLADRERAWPRELSGGQRQRLALARALATDADLLLMDEPLSAVDALLRESLQDTLLDLWRTRGHTQLFVTHSIEEAVYLGKRILVFSDRPGTVIADIPNPHAGTPAWRDDPAFTEQTRALRHALANTAPGHPDSHAKLAAPTDGERFIEDVAHHSAECVTEHDAECSTEHPAEPSTDNSVQQSRFNPKDTMAEHASKESQIRPAPTADASAGNRA